MRVSGNRTFGMIRLKVTVANLAVLLDSMNRNSITAWDVRYIDELTAEITVGRKAFPVLTKILAASGGAYHTVSVHGIYWYLQRILHRPVLICGILLLCFLSAYLPTRVLFIRVEGNRTIPSRLILEKAADCGVSFGASRANLRSEKLKNSLISAIPQLQWAGINTNGCCALISVTERDDTGNDVRQSSVCSIVAARDGIIWSCTATAGNPLCKPGQAVKAGQTLISGYTNCGLVIRGSRAEGEVFAKTEHMITVKMPVNYFEKGTKTSAFKKISLIIGKKRINLWKDSGICDTFCDKMYQQYYIVLPGGFQLPVSLVIEDFQSYDADAVRTAVETAPVQLQTFAESYLRTQMIAGQILRSGIIVRSEGDVAVLQGRYSCLEMIGREQIEEIEHSYGKND